MGQKNTEAGSLPLCVLAVQSCFKTLQMRLFVQSPLPFITQIMDVEGIEKRKAALPKWIKALKIR